MPGRAPQLFLGLVLMPDPTSAASFDETKHPRGQPKNRGQFKDTPVPAPPPVTRRPTRGPAGASVSVEEIARDAVARPEHCARCRDLIVIVPPQPGYEPVGWCHCGDYRRAALGLPPMVEIIDEITRQGRLPVPNCPYCGVELECSHPTAHVQGLHGRECHAARHVVECRENQAGGPSLSPPGGTITYEGPAPTSSTTPASRGSEEPQEEGAADTDPPPRRRRKARNAATAAASAVLVAGSTVPGWSSVLEVQLTMAAATAAILVQAPHILREAHRNWREGTELKMQGRQLDAEVKLLSELNGQLSRLSAGVTAANDAIAGFDEATERSDQRNPTRDKMASAMRRALVAEATARLEAASAATARARAIDDLPYQERTEAIAELIGELKATAPD